VPVYCYKCNDCTEEFEVKHSMSFEDQECPNCKSSNLFRVPSLGKSNNATIFKQTKTGKVVDDYIRDVKKEVQKEKKDLRSRVL